MEERKDKEAGGDRQSKGGEEQMMRKRWRWRIRSIVETLLSICTIIGPGGSQGGYPLLDRKCVIC